MINLINLIEQKYRTDKNKAFDPRSKHIIL